MNKKSMAALIGIILGIILLIMGFSTTTPDRELPRISRFGEGTPAYVGGDAYNFIIESSLRGGEIAGATMARAVYISAGLLTITVSAIAFASELDKKEATPAEAVMPTDGKTVE